MIRRLTPKVPPTDETRILDELHDRVKKLAAQKPSDLQESEVAEIERLDRLATLLRKHRPDHSSLVWLWLVLIAGAALVAVISLSQLRVSNTEITLISDVSYLEFTLATSQAVIGAIALKGLESVGSDVELPRERRTTDPVALRVAPGGDLSFDPGTLPAETQVWLRPGDRPSTYLLRLRSPARAQVAATTRGALAIGIRGREWKPDLEGRPGSIRFNLDEKTVTDFMLEFAEPAPLRIGPGLEVKDLKLHRVPEQSDAREISSILDGKLYLEERDGRLVTLRAGQILLVDGLSRAELREVILKPDRVSLVFGGQVTTLATGSAAARSNLMPTWMQYLQARELPSILWAGLAVAASILAAVAALMSYRQSRRGG